MVRGRTHRGLVLMVSPERYHQDQEAAAYEQYLNETIQVFCPYCGDERRKGKLSYEFWELQDWHTGYPPLQNILTVNWACGECYENFSVDYRLNEDGFLKKYEEKEEEIE